MGRKKKRGKKNKLALILLSIVGIVVIIVIVVLYQSQEAQPKSTAEEYFEISGATYDGFIEGNGTELILHMLTFNFTAVKGDAHQVVIQNLGPDPQSPSHDTYWDLGTMLQGEVRTVRLSTEKGVHIHLGEKGFPVRIRITSEETFKEPQKQFITIYL